MTCLISKLAASLARMSAAKSGMTQARTPHVASLMRATRLGRHRASLRGMAGNFLTWTARSLSSGRALRADPLAPFARP
jgi:hypothetical protein